MVGCDTYSRNALEQKAIQVLNLNVEKESLPIQDLTIDVVISFHLIEHLKNSKNFLEEVFRVLKNGGNFIMVTPDWRKQYKTFWRDHTHIHPYDKKSVARLLRCFAFDIVWLRSFGCIRGIGRSGLWKIWPSLMFTGPDLIVVAKKHKSSTVIGK